MENMTTEQIVMNQYKQRQRLKWKRKLPKISGIVGIVSGVATLAGFLLGIYIVTLVSIILTIISAAVSVWGMYVPPDQRSHTEKYLNDWSDRAIKETKRKKARK